jgi:hypothetical protein
MGELAELSGRPSLVDAYAKEAVEALVIPPRRLRDLVVEEAELGERSHARLDPPPCRPSRCGSRRAGDRRQRGSWPIFCASRPLAEYRRRAQA